MNQTSRAVRILVADDSAVVREALSELIDEQPDMVVVGTATDGPSAVREARRLRPDLIAMDLLMPGLDGVEATTEIMRTVPTPIVIVTTASLGEGSNVTFRALEAGAVDILPKPSASKLKTPEQRKAFVRQLRLASAVRVVGRRTRLPAVKNEVAQAGESGGIERSTLVTGLREPERRAELSTLGLIAIGASTGGPPCLRVVLSALDPAKCPPVVIVQHMPGDFIPGLATWLDELVGVSVRVACPGDLLQPGTAYLASGNRHLKVLPGGRLTVDDSPQVHYQRPSVDILFESIADNCGADAAGVLLTGMGVDGALGLLRMRRAGSWTIAQDEASCVVFGMPGEAVRLGAAIYSASPEHIGRLLAPARHAALGSERAPRRTSSPVRATGRSS